MQRTIKPLENKIGENLESLSFGDEVSDANAKSQSMKKIADKLDFF